MTFNRRVSGFLLVALIVAAVAALVYARSGQSAPAAKGQASSAPEPLAIVEGQTLTSADVDARASDQLTEVRAQEARIREAALNALIDEKLLEKAARDKGQSLQDYMRVEIQDKVVVSEQEKRDTYERYRAQLAGMSEQDAMARVEQAIAEQKAELIREALVGRLRATADLKMLVEPSRVAVNVPSDAPSRGPAGAPVTIVEFSDFQCPFCSRVNPTIDQVLSHYGDRVRLVFRDYPLPIHAEAPKAHEAGRCAAEQGRFWPMHDRMFADQTALGVEGLKKSAADIGLDRARFDACLDSGRHAAAVQKDLSEGQSYGVNGTPAFFVNGRLISGAQPFAQFTRLIDDELQRKGVARPAQ
jgi:protein-disulfide isomerase